MSAARKIDTETKEKDPGPAHHETKEAKKIRRAVFRGMIYTIVAMFCAFSMAMLSIFRGQINVHLFTGLLALHVCSFFMFLHVLAYNAAIVGRGVMKQTRED